MCPSDSSVECVTIGRSYVASVSFSCGFSLTMHLKSGVMAGRSEGPQGRERGTPRTVVADMDDALPWRVWSAVAQQVERALGREARVIVPRAGDVRQRTRRDAGRALQTGKWDRVDVALRGRRVRRLEVPVPYTYKT